MVAHHSPLLLLCLLSVTVGWRVINRDPSGGVEQAPMSVQEAPMSVVQALRNKGSKGPKGRKKGGGKKNKGKKPPKSGNKPGNKGKKPPKSGNKAPKSGNKAPKSGNKQAPKSNSNAVAVGIQNFLQAETQEYVNKLSLPIIGRFFHSDKLTEVCPGSQNAPTHCQTVIRSNRDTLYSAAVIDLTKEAKLTFPDTKGRFMSLTFISEVHDVFPMAYTAGQYYLKKKGCGCEPPCKKKSCISFGTRYAVLLVRTYADANSEKDLKDAQLVQNNLKISQQSGGRGRWSPTKWDVKSLDEVRSHLLALADTLESGAAIYGFLHGPEKVDTLLGVISVAAGWGGVRAEDQKYFNWIPPSTGSYTMTLKDVPVEGFWSVTVYNKEGFMFAEPANYNSVRDNAGGSGTTILYFGDCTKGVRQPCLPIQNGWNMVMRLFRPTSALFDGSWKFPEPISDKR